jgi:signal transduction histidine kinase/ligand-binding sensor domain-containing protein/DNA-binding response OmpR family regulator
MNKQKNIFVLTVFLLALLKVAGQKYSFEYLTTEQGLSQSTVNAILQDQRGFIWIGTGDGLDKFDGYSIHRYSHDNNNPKSLSKNAVLSLYEDSEGFIWIGTYGGGLNKFDYSSQTFAHYESNPEKTQTLSNNQVFEIFEDSEGIFWLGTEQGVDKFNRETEVFEKINNKLDIGFGRTEAIVEDKYGDIWIAGSNGVFRYNRLNEKFAKYNPFENDDALIPANYSWEVYMDRNNDLWVGSFWGLSRFNYSSNRFENYAFGKSQEFNTKFHVREIYEDSGKTMWIGTDGNGLFTFDRQENTFLKVNQQGPNTRLFNGNVVTAIYEDQTGNLWFGTFKSGVNKLDRLTQKFQIIKHDPNNPNTIAKNDIKSIYQDENNVLWIGTEKGGLSRIDTKKGTVKTFVNIPGNKNSLPSDVVVSIVDGGDDKLWIGTFGGGFSRFDTQTETFVNTREIINVSDSVTSNVVWTILPDLNGKLWLGTWGAGLHLYNPNNNSFENFNIIEEGFQSNNSILCAARDYQGYIWIGTYGDGLKKINPLTKQVEHFRNIESDSLSLTDNVVHTIFEDNNRNIWIGTKDGLDLFNKETGNFTHFNTSHGLPNNVINGILQDDENFLWISTNRGISKFDIRKKEFRNFDIKDGLQGNEFNRGVCFKTNSGNFLFGGVNGLNIFNPAEIKDNPNIPNVVLTDLKIKNKSVAFGENEKIIKEHISAAKEVVLPYNFSMLILEFAALNYTIPEKNQYAYFLKNYDENWQYVGNQRTATYTNLNPGEYEFLVKASNNDGIWNETGTSVKITVTPPFWKTWWFRTIIVFTIWGAFTLLFMLRTKSIKRQKIELEKLVTARTAELQTQKNKVEVKNRELETQKQEIIKQRDQVKEMTQKVHEADQMKLRFFTNISHEFRTPLTLILGPIEKMLSNEKQNEETKGQLKLMHRNSLRLLRLVNEIMDFRKIELGRMKLRVSKNDFAAFVHEIYFSFNEVAKRNNIEYLFHCSQSGITGWFDRDKIEKILYNLISNAFKFTPPGGKIEVLAEEQNGMGILHVRDNGRGISKENLEKIFDRFFQVEKSGNPAWSGSGIGLSYTKNLIDIHRGTIDVESEKWHGTTFKVTIPLKKSTFSTDELVDSVSVTKENFITPLRTLSDFEIENETNISEGGRDSGEKPRVLIIEDNADVRKYIIDEINRDYKVVEAENGKEGLEIAKKQNFDLIVSDIMMPEMDGLELCEKIKTDLNTSHIPVILLTARTSDDYRLKGLKLGADDYVFKPFNATVLCARIQNLIENRKLLKQRYSKDLTLTPKDVTLTSPDEKFLTKTLDIIEKYISDSNFNVDKLVAEIGMSRSVYYRKLKNLTGQSANDFIKTIRLKRAAQILQQNKFTISEVSYEVGFNDPQYFSKCFHRHFGKTPTQYIAEQTSALN